MSKASSLAKPGWASLLSLLWLASDLVSCQTSTYKFSSTPTNFQGFWVANPTSVQQMNCATTRTWTTSGSYGACCIEGTICTFYTGCKGGTVTRMDGTHWTCSSDFPDCYTMTVLPSSPYLVASSSWLIMGCANNWKANTVYRQIVPTNAAVTKTLTAEGTTVTALPSLSKTVASQTSEPPNPGQVAGDAQQTAPPDDQAPSQQTTQGSTSQAWIAGAVIGPIAALAGLGFLFFLLGKRRGEKEKGGAGSPTASAPLDPAAHQGNYYAGGHPGSVYSGSAASPPPMGYAPMKAEMPVYGPGPGGYPQQGYPQQGYPQQGYPQQGYYPSPSPPVHELPNPSLYGPQELPAQSGR